MLWLTLLHLQQLHALNAQQDHSVHLLENYLKIALQVHINQILDLLIAMNAQQAIIVTQKLLQHLLNAQPVNTIQ